MNGLQKAAYVFMILGTVLAAVGIIPLFWCIPMCIKYHKNPKAVGTGFKVCSLIFVSFIGGILMLCDNEK